MSVPLTSPPAPAAAPVILDPERLRALHGTGLLDSGPEPVFDRLTQLVVQTLGVPTAALSLVDADRQYFKSLTGDAEMAALGQTGLSHSFCQFAVAAGASIVTRDAREHDLLHDSQAIGDLGVIAYAGVPLIDADGHALGALCAIADAPRQWEDADVALLEGLAQAAMAEIARRRAATEADRAAALLADQRRLLEMIAAGADLPRVLEQLCHVIEAHQPGSACSILLLEDGRLHTGAAPSLPLSYRDAIDGIEIGPGVGTCGAAACSGEIQVTEDIARDERWEAFVDLALSHGLASCWSLPVKDPEGACLGSFAVYHAHPHSPTPQDLALGADAAHLAGLAIARHHSDERLHERARQDELTGLANRAVMTERLAEMLANRRCGTAVLLVDLDRLRVINDSLGHETGDALVRQAAERLQATVRPSDLVARFSGDSFVILCGGVRGESTAVRVAERIARTLREPFVLDGEAQFVSASIGIALSRAGMSAADLLRFADAAMYRVKNAGGDGHAVFDDAMRAEATRRHRLENALREALARDEMHLVYQPIVDTHGRPRAMETLLRWTHEGEFVSPAEFIPIAERTGLIEPIGRWVVATALAERRRWRDAGVDEAVTVSVNVSARQITDMSFAAFVLDRLGDNGHAPSLLTLEVTESALLSAAGQATLELLDGAGVRLSLDDFGTGWSSVSRLRELPFGELKIDRSFVAAEDARSIQLVEALVAGGRLLGMEVVAEGVETAEQAAWLRGAGCPLAQGYYFSRPVGRDQALELLLDAQVPPPPALAA